MNNLNEISSSLYADDVMSKIDDNFAAVESAIDTLEQSGGGGGGSTTVATPKFINNPFPYWKSELRVLCLANSYTYTPLMYLGELVDASGIDKTKFRIELAYKSGMSLEQWNTDITNNTSPTGKYLMGGGTLDGSSTTNGGIRDVIAAKQWDVIVVQQNSDNSTSYSTFEPYLTNIVNAIRRYCPNQKVCIAWQQTWSKSNFVTNYGLINTAVKSMLANNGVDYIIPTGTAIQNARGLTGKSLMFDASGHLAAGVARYVGSCTWFQALLAPVFNVSIVGNTATHAETNSNDYMGSYYGGFGEEASGYTGNGVQVTSSNNTASQLCALYALTDMWNGESVS